MITFLYISEMMADLIRTSMFCDVNDVIRNNEHWSLYESLCVDDNITSQNEACSANFMEFMTRSTDHVDDVAMDTNVTFEQQQQQSRQQTTNHIESELNNKVCDSVVASPEVCQDFMSRIAQASKVDYSTFNHVHPGDIFCNNYLQPIVSEKQTTHKPNSESKPEVATQFLRPPYSYAACAVAAIYLTGKDSASPNDIFEKLCSVFEDMRVGNKQLFKKQLGKTLRSSNIFEQVDRGIFRVRSGKVDQKVFQLQANVDPKRKEKYAATIHEHLHIPSMLEHFDIELVRKEKAPRKKPERVVSEMLKYRSSLKKQTVQSVKKSRDINDDLKMPDRPCFHDNSDVNELSHIPRHNTCPEPVDSVSANFCNNESIHSFQESMNLEQTSQRVSSTHHTPSVVVPAPRYVVASPTACVPLRSQEYHIPNVGTFRLVDMYYNAQIIHQLVV